MTTTGRGNELDRQAGAALPCEHGDPDLWFAERLNDVETAKLLCRSCPIRQRCLADALQRAEPWGVWGGEILIRGAVVSTKRGRGRPPGTHPTRRGATTSPNRPSTWTAA